MYVSDKFFTALQTFRDAYVMTGGFRKTGLVTSITDRDHATLVATLNSVLISIGEAREGFTDIALAGMFSIAGHLAAKENPIFNEDIGEFLRAYHARTRQLCSFVDGRFHVAIESTEDAPLQLQQVTSLQSALESSQKRLTGLSEKSRKLQETLDDRDAEIAILRAELERQEQIMARQSRIEKARAEFQQAMDTLNSVLGAESPPAARQLSPRVPSSLSFHRPSVPAPLPPQPKNPPPPPPPPPAEPPLPASPAASSSSTDASRPAVASKPQPVEKTPSTPSGANMSALFAEMQNHKLLRHTKTGEAPAGASEGANPEKKTPEASAC